MKLAMKLSRIIQVSLCCSLYCAENSYNTDKITQKSFSAGTPRESQNTILKEQKRIKHITTVKNCINGKKLVPTEIIFTADNDITQVALRHNQHISDQVLQKK